jgi:hypothetical protein
MKDTNAGEAIPESITSHAYSGWTRFLRFLESLKSLADSLEIQFQPINDPSLPAKNEIVKNSVKSQAFALAICASLTNNAVA